MTSASLLREARRRAGLTQRQLAERAGLTQPVIAAYEAGRREPTVPMLRKLLRAAGFELETSIRRSRRLPDAARAARDLRAVLDLADALPHRPPGRLRYPRLPA